MTKKNYFWRQQVWLPIAKGADYWCNVATETFCLLLFFGTPCLLALVVVLIVALAPKALEDSPRVETSGEGLGGQADLDKHKHKHTAHSTSTSGLWQAQAQAKAQVDKQTLTSTSTSRWVSVFSSLLARTLTSPSLHLDHQRDLQLCFPFFLSFSLCQHVSSLSYVLYMLVDKL